MRKMRGAHIAIANFAADLSPGRRARLIVCASALCRIQPDGGTSQRRLKTEKVQEKPNRRPFGDLVYLDEMRN